MKIAWKRARNNHREALLETHTREKVDRSICLTTFNMPSYHIKKIITKNWRILNSNGLDLECHFFSFKKSASIRNILVHIRPSGTGRGERPSLTTMGLPPVTGHYTCGGCKACPLTTNSRRIEVGLPTPWEQQNHTTCNSSNVIYFIKCPCDLLYVGMTTRRVKIRILEQMSNIRCGRLTMKLTTHFIEMQHSENDLKWTVLDKPYIPPNN